MKSGMSFYAVKEAIVQFLAYIHQLGLLYLHCRAFGIRNFYF